MPNIFQGLSSALDVTAALVDVGSVIAPNHLKGLKQESVVISGHQDDSAIDLSKLLGCHGSDHSTSMHSTLDEISWPERRLLALIEQSRKSVEAMNKAKVGGDGLMTPSCGDFVILESGELLRLLKEHEKKSEESLEVVVPKRVIKLSAADHEESQCASWPEVLYSEHPCLQYNRGAKSESLDRELQRIQRAFVGLGPKETASSTLCHKDEKCQIVVAKKKVVRTKQEKRRQSLTHEGDSSDKRCEVLRLGEHGVGLTGAAGSILTITNNIRMQIIGWGCGCPYLCTTFGFAASPPVICMEKLIV